MTGLEMRVVAHYVDGLISIGGFGLLLYGFYQWRRQVWRRGRELKSHPKDHR